LGHARGAAANIKAAIIKKDSLSRALAIAPRASMPGNVSSAREEGRGRQLTMR
jgi:hypothetical protein